MSKKVQQRSKKEQQRAALRELNEQKVMIRSSEGHPGILRIDRNCLDSREWRLFQRR